MKAEEAKCLKQLETENQRLKKLVAEQTLGIDMRKELAEVPHRWESCASGRSLRIRDVMASPVVHRKPRHRC
jgi:hypothetical protein